MIMTSKKINYKFVIYAVFTIGILCMHFPMEYFNDDAGVISSIETMNLLEFFVSRFYSNGKILTDVFANLFYRLPMLVWKFFDTAVYLALAYLIVHTFTEDTWQDVLTVCLLIGLFPFWYMSTAGWVATTTNYLYPLFCLIIVCSFIKRIKIGRHIGVAEYILVGCAVVYATNQDQAAVILVGGLLLYLIYSIVFGADKRIIRCVTACFCFSLFSYGVMFMLPGHLNRMDSTAEMIRWLPEYENWSLFKKFYKGYTSTAANLFFNDVKLFDLFCFLLLLLSVRNEKYTNRIIGCIPFLSVLGIHLIGADRFVVYPPYTGGMPELPGFGSGWTGIAVLMLTVVVVFSVFYTVFSCTTDQNSKWMLLMLLFLACGSRLMMGLSATIYASHARTFTYFIYALIICNLIIFKELKKRDNSWLIGIGAVIAMLLSAGSPFYWQRIVMA